MEGCLTDIRKTLVDKLLDKAIEKSRYLFCFTCIVKEFDEEKVKLEAERATMTQRFDVATQKNKDVQVNAQLWQEQVDKLIQEDTKKKQSCFFGFCPDCIWRYKRGEELSTKIEEIKNLMKKGEKFDNVELTRCLPGVERYSSQYYISFNSRELKYIELLDALKDDNNYMVGLHGMAGAGKTTLAKEVGKQLKTLELFKYVIDTTVSFNVDMKKIQDDIAGSLGLEWRDINESDRPKQLWSRLTNGDKILVILDDVWKNLNFDDIGFPNSDNHKGCKVLVTTRELGVCEQMGCGKTIQLELLTEEEALIMFKMYADLSNISSKSISGKVREITTLCKRLPVAIATIARSLKGKKSREEWDVALNCLQKPVFMGNVKEDLVDIFKCLKFSYDNLKDEKAKGLFLLCSAFPEDEEIPVELLTRLGIGVNLFGEDYDKYNDARSQVIAAKNKLLNSCLLLETEKGDVKMHDLVREVAQWIANEEILAVNLFEKNQKSLVERSKNIKYLLFQGKPMDLFSSRFDGSKLEILIVKTSMFEDVPTSFFENMAGLRVLNFSNSFSKRLSLLAKSIKLMINIRSLLVESVILGDISVLGSLQSLETLELHSCTIDEFSPEIAMLNKLRLLSLRWCEIRRNNPFEVILRCPSLEELYFCQSFNDSCHEITLPTLQRYHLIDNFSYWNCSQSKGVDLKEDHLSQATYKYVMKTSYYLHLWRIKGWRNLMPEMVPIEEGMNDLIELHLREISQLQCLVDTKHNSQVPIVFSKLVVLKLAGMDALKELCNGPISFDSMNNLEKLSIKECGSLRSLFKCSLNLNNLKIVKLKKCLRLVSVFELSTSQSLPLLEELKIIDCDKLENIITFEESADSYNDNKSCYSLFPKLKFLFIYKCHRLQFILPILSARDLLLLEVIKIEFCYKLKYIFGQHQDAKLPSLKQFVIAELPNFIDIFPPNASSISKDGSKPQTQLDLVKGNTFSLCCNGYKLKSTKTPLDSEDQPQDCSISMELRGNEENGQQMNFSLEHILLGNLPMMRCLFVGLKYSFVLKNLTTMKIVGCEKLEIVFSTSFLRCLPQLVSLRVEECKELKHIIENDLEDKISQSSITFFPKLKTLIVTKCDKLKYVFPVSICKEFPDLKFMLIREANELEEIFKSEVEIPNLKVVGFANLPSLCHAQEVHFQAVKHRFVHSCQKLSLTSCNEGGVDSRDFSEGYSYLHSQFDKIRKECYKAASEHKLTSPQELMDQHPLGETDTSNKPSQEYNLEGSTSEITAAATVSTITETKNKPPKQKGIQINVEEGTASTNAKIITLSTPSDVAGSSSGQLVTSECKTSSQLEVSTSEITSAATLSTITETKNKSPTQEGIQINVEEGTSSANAKTITSSTHECKTSSQEDGDSQIAMTSISISTIETHDQGSLINHDSFKKVSSNIEEQFPKDEDKSVSKSKPSPSITSVVAYQFPLMPCKEDPCQKVEDLSSSLLVKSELEQLVSKNHLDWGNFYLLNDFFVKHPSVRLKDTSLSNRYKGCAYNLLAELLKFLKTHSVLEVLGSFHSEFVELLQDARSFGFDKDWLDGVERRALFPDIERQKLLDYKQQVTKDVEGLRLKIGILSEHVEDLKQQLTSSEAVLDGIIQQEVVLSAPIGY